MLIFLQEKQNQSSVSKKNYLQMNVLQNGQLNNSSLKELEETRHNIYGEENINAWLRLRESWHQLLVMLFDDIAVLMSEKFFKKNFLPEFAINIQSSPCLMPSRVLIFAKFSVAKVGT